MVRLFRLTTASFLSVFLAACGGVQKASTPEVKIPEPRGAVIRIENNDIPYTVQGVSAVLAPSYKDASARKDQLFVIVLIEIKGELVDRPTPAGKPAFAARHPGCSEETGCPIFRVEDAPVTMESLQNKSTPAIWGIRPSILQPKTPYYMSIYADVPASTNLKEIKVCKVPSFQESECIKLSDLVVS